MPNRRLFDRIGTRFGYGWLKKMWDLVVRLLSYCFAATNQPALARPESDVNVEQPLEESQNGRPVQEFAGDDQESTNSSNDDIGGCNTSDYFPSNSSDPDSHDVRGKKRRSSPNTPRTLSRSVPDDSSSSEEHLPNPKCTVNSLPMSSAEESSGPAYSCKPMPASENTGLFVQVTGVSDPSSDESGHSRLPTTQPVVESAKPQTFQHLKDKVVQLEQENHHLTEEIQYLRQRLMIQESRCGASSSMFQPSIGPSTIVSSAKKGHHYRYASSGHLNELRYL